MVNFAKVPKDFRTFTVPPEHRPLFRQEFNKGFTVDKDGFLHFFDTPIGTTQIKLTGLQKFALIGTTIGALGTCSVGAIGLAKKPFKIPTSSVEVTLNPESNKIPDLNLTLEGFINTPDTSKSTDRIQLKCAPIIRNSNSKPYYVCSQQIPN